MNSATSVTNYAKLPSIIID